MVTENCPFCSTFATAKISALFLHNCEYKLRLLYYGYCVERIISMIITSINTKSYSKNKHSSHIHSNSGTRYNTETIMHPSHMWNSITRRDYPIPPLNRRDPAKSKLSQYIPNIMTTSLISIIWKILYGYIKEKSINDEIDKIFQLSYSWASRLYVNSLLMTRFNS